MSNHMAQTADVILQAASEMESMVQLNDIDAEPDTSSSLSEIEYKDSQQEEDGEISEGHSNDSEEENDSEAETERLEDSPNHIRTHKDVVLSSRNHIYERSPSKLHNQIIPDDQRGDEEEDELLSDDELSLNESPKSSVHDENELPPAQASLESSAGQLKRALSTTDNDTRKRKRSIMAGSGLDEEEPMRKRTGSVINPADDFAIDDEEQAEQEIDTSNPISGTISGDEGGEEQEGEIIEEIEVLITAEESLEEATIIPASPKKRGRKKKKAVHNGVNSHDDNLENLPDAEAVRNGQNEAGEEEIGGQEGDNEAEALARSEEEQEKKRIASEQLSSLEKQFTTFRERLHDERLESLNREEAMLREDKPTHPKHLAMMKAIDARRDAKLRVNDKLREYEEQTLRNYAVARRSQILVQFQQEVRDIREKKLEQLGKQWYEIQHDRRSYAGSVPDYTLKFPAQRTQQVMHQIAYSNEVSILSGIAKHVGFPAAPPMSMATEAEMAEDLMKMGVRPRHQPIHAGAGSALHELAALRTVGTRFKPAEEQFIEQTPWANPQHPSHAHLLQRQNSIQQAPRTMSPFTQAPHGQRRHSHQHTSGPISGTFSTSIVPPQSNSAVMSGGRVSPHPHNPFSNITANAHAIVPSPLGSRQTSLSPQLNRQPPEVISQQNQPVLIETMNSKGNGMQQPSASFPEARELPPPPPARRGILTG